MNITSSLNRAILSSLYGKYFLYVFQIISLMILSRIFTPEMFGKVALLQALTMFFQVIAVSGLVPALIFQEKINSEEKNGIFSFTLILGTVASLIYVFLILLYNFYFSISDLISIVFFICIFFSAISVVPLGSLQKDAKFKVISIAEIIAEVLTLFISLIMYYCGSGLYALMSKLLLTPVIRFFSYYYFSKNTSLGRANIGNKVSAIKPLIPFAKNQVIFNLFVYFSRNLDTLLIAKYFGTSTLGYYEKTYQIVKYPLQLFTFAINPALQPVLTQHRKSPEMVSIVYYSLLLKLLFLGCFCSALIYFCAKDIIFIMFGEQWFPAINVLQILCLSIPSQMVLSSTGGVFQSFGETNKMLKCGLFSGSINISAILIGVVCHDLELMCKLLVLGYIINLVQCFYILHKKVFEQRINKFLFFILVIVSSPTLFMLKKVEFNIMENSITSSLTNLFIHGFTIGVVALMLYFFTNKLLNKTEI